MPTPNISINPMLTSNAAGSFNVESNGYVQGTAMPDPAVRFALAGGVLAAAETFPMWGGTLIFENIPLSTLSSAPGGGIGRATSILGATGISVFDQAYGAVNSPQSPVPLIGSGGQVNFYRFNSGARIAVACDPALAASLGGGLITQQVSWDFTNQQLIQYNPLDAQIAITSQTWSAGVVTVVSATPHGRAVGDWVTLSGAVPSPYNGDFQIQSVADTTHFTYVLATNPGTSPASTPGVILAGGGALPCKILDIRQGNSKVVVYDPVTNFATWNPTGTAAIIQI